MANPATTTWRHTAIVLSLLLSASLCHAGRRQDDDWPDSENYDDTGDDSSSSNKEWSSGEDSQDHEYKHRPNKESKETPCPSESPTPPSPTCPVKESPSASPSPSCPKKKSPSPSPSPSCPKRKSPSPSPSTMVPSRSPSPSASASAEPSESPSSSPSPSASASVSPLPSESQSPSPSASASSSPPPESPSGSPSPSSSPSSSPSASASSSPVPVPSQSASPSPSASSTPSLSPSPSLSGSPTASPSASISPSPSSSPSTSASSSPCPSPSPSPSTSPSASASATSSPSLTPSTTPSGSPSPSSTPSLSPSPSLSATPSNTPSPTPSRTPSPTSSPSTSVSPILSTPGPSALPTGTPLASICPQPLLGVAAGFSAFVFGNESNAQGGSNATGFSVDLVNGDFESAASVNGGLRLRSFGLFQNSPCTDQASLGATLIVNGPVNVVDTHLFCGNLLVANQNDVIRPPSFQAGNGVMVSNVSIDFSSVRTNLTGVSASLCALTNATPADTNVFGDVRLRATGLETEVFTLDVAALSRTGFMRLTNIDASVTQSVIINVLGSGTARFSNFFFDTGSIPQGLITWNICSADRVVIENFLFPGTLLAPAASVTLQKAQVVGSVVASSLSGSGGGQITVARCP